MYLSCMICRPINYTQALPQAAPSTFISLVPVENDTAKWQVQSVKSLFFDSFFVILTFLYFFRLVTGTVYHFTCQKTDRPPSPCGLHSLTTLDAVQPGSLIPAPSISIKAGSVQQRKQEPTTQTHTQALNRLDALGMLERFFIFCGFLTVKGPIKWTRATILTLSNCMNLCFEPFSQIALCCIFSQGQEGMQRIKKCWERPQSLILPSLKFPTRSPRHRCRADPCNGNVFAIQSWSCVSKQTISMWSCASIKSCLALQP